MKLQTRLPLILGILLCLFSINLQAQINPIEQASAKTTLPNSPTTEIIFDELEFDFGTILSGESITYTYIFTNTGDVPLVLSNAKGSCGCTVPSWPKEPMLPGETGAIVVSFDSKNKSGNQSKRVTITANTNPAQTFLTIRGIVEKPDAIIQEVEKETLTIEEETAEKLTLENRKSKLAIDTKNCFAIFPNPTSNVLKLDLKDNMGKSAIIRIFSPQGQLLVEKDIDKIEGIIEMNVSDYTAGTYFANVQIDGQTAGSHCFVVQ